MRQHGQAKVNRRKPRAFGVCDRCGFLYNKHDLQWQYEWMGARTQNTNMLVCDRCLDDLQEQLRTVVLPADPTPLANPRPENYAYADNQIATIGTNIGNINQAAGLAAAFDSNANKPFFLSAVRYRSTAGLTNTIGKYWGGLDPNNPTQGPMASRFVVSAPNDAKLAAAGAVAYAFQGSNVPAGFTTLASGVTAGTVGEIIDVTITPTTGYLYHQFVLTGDGASSVSVAQLQIYRAS
jgi:hypothetical protein